MLNITAKFKNTHKLIFLVILVLLLSFALLPSTKAHAQAPDENPPQSFPYQKTFVISSYYTTLPDQPFYITGSYDGDVRLNGEGVTAADGTKVYPGLAAAPKTFPFGTKMDIPGFGTVAVHDRGGAIKGNRLDIWVGSGDEGLRRALAWGLRTVNVTVYGIDENIKESVNIAGLPLAAQVNTMARTRYFKVDLAEGDDGEAVSLMQRYLKKFGFFDAEVTGFYGKETNAAVLKFQLSEKVIDDAADTGAGNFGPRTRVALENLMQRHTVQALARVPQEELRPGGQGTEVRQLQDLLKEEGFLAQITGAFDENTEDALTRFQLDVGVISGAQEVGAGFYGPKTQTALEKHIRAEFEPQASYALQPPEPVQVASIVSLTSAQKSVFTAELSLNDSGPQVQVLQEELRRLHFFGLQATGFYGKTTQHAVLKYQQAAGLISSENEQGAGVIGPRTRESLNRLVAARTTQKTMIAQKASDKNLLAQRVATEKNLVAGIFNNIGFNTELQYGARADEVENLQTVLKKLGFFPGRVTTDYFGDITKHSLISFQKNHGLETSGAMDEPTRNILNTLIKSV